MLLLAVWLPATVHCELESIGAIPMDECCETAAGGSGGHSDNACKTVEDSSYKLECFAALPDPPETPAVSIVLRVVSCAPGSGAVAAKQSPFETHHLPQFVIRTALPIRGPSVTG
jgi:hypothetical protein